MKIFMHLSLCRIHILRFFAVSLCVGWCVRVVSPHWQYVAGTQA